MAKNIVICSDGTGNSAVKDRGTNVFKIFESIDLNGHRFNPKLDPQVPIYDDGVGTEDFRPLKIFAGITGWGLSRNVKQLYKELVASMILAIKYFCSALVAVLSPSVA
jgi:uncharacterized protein (DUF2235 family)